MPTATSLGSPVGTGRDTFQAIAMGAIAVLASTVEVMATPEERGENGAPKSTPRLPARTVAISVCIAFIGALAVGLVANWVTDDSTSTATSAGESVVTMPLTSAIDSDALLEVELLTIEGEPTSLGERLEDRPVLVNLWAQNCAPCIEEMPLLEQAHLDNADIDVLGVDTQDRLEDAKVMAERTGITYPWVQDRDGNFFYAAQGAGMPTTFIIMPSGEIVASKTGAFDSQDELQSWIDNNVA